MGICLEARDSTEKNSLAEQIKMMLFKYLQSNQLLQANYRLSKVTGT